MKKKLITLVAFISAIVLFVAAIAADLSGKWEGTLSIPNSGSIPVSYNFKVDGNKLTGMTSSQAGNVAIDNGKIDGNNFSFSVNIDGMIYPHTGKFYTDSCGVDVDFGDVKSHMKLTRSK